jgi:hypothetical protein
MNTSDTINDLAAALATAQASMGPAIKGKKNPHFRSNYADLSSVVEAIREPFTANGLSWVQAPSVDPETGLVTVTTRILHSSGQWMEASVAAMPGRGGKPDLSPQAVGSAVTYLRRYGLQAMAGVPSADDDGEAAMGRHQQRREPPRQQRRAPAPAPAPAPEKWSDQERARFCAKLGDLGLEYDAVAEYCESIKRPRPSLMGEERRVQLLAYLEGAADVVAGLQGE